MSENNANLAIIACIVVIIAILLMAVTLPVSELINDNEIAIIEINGNINYVTNSTNSSVDYIETGIKDANDNPNVKAILIEVNCKKGSLVASEELSKIIKESKKPTVSWISDYGLSEGYLIASSADTVIATPYSAIGGIGKSFEDSTKYSHNKISGQYNSSLINKNKLKSSNLLNPQEMINQDYTYFIKLIAQNRGLKASYVSKIANSKVYNGNEALKLKLIDKIGDKEKAIKITASKANLTDYHVVIYPQDQSTKLTSFLHDKWNFKK
ncbi:MAG: S49 family peptidase [Methanobacteriaceae archaeon]|nr:S49 family peptidase [Methanobacteriaceae archaeon]